jgi:hypothetical protein
VVADADSLELLALERAQLILRGVPKQELQSIGVSSGWSVVKAQRLFSKDQAKKMKGLWPDQLGIEPIIIEPNTIVVPPASSQLELSID